MFLRRGFTLIEILVVLLILGIIVAVALPNFQTPNEHSYASVARNNLLSIYSAQKIYFNNNNGFCITVAASACGTIATINLSLGLDIQDDTYTYACTTDPLGSGFACTATRNDGSALPGDIYLTVTNNPITNTLTTVNPNPKCTAANNNWCP